eukprot:CAMPEP_0196571474 /NCGR_PEP_ID=MMETSP1081-20130531/1647_1 /TAXON_ID=36882 /ORGANISM="Pyramimonas amylifera, Strain CCMP720" /LENGTH=256 /DNA_ID=CAMNT_0041888437 /DNA_START=368 /DNA_END=1139 /DNA_ORIENTATION=+
MHIFKARYTHTQTCGSFSIRSGADDQRFDLEHGSPVVGGSLNDLLLINDSTSSVQSFDRSDTGGGDLGGSEFLLPRQGDAIVKGVGQAAVAERPGPPDLSYLQELIAIQESGPKEIGFFGTRNMGYMHQQLIEILSYAMVLTKNHIYTSGATGTNAAVIRGALRAESPDLLTVVLPQSLAKQPRESREMLLKVKNVIETPENDNLALIDASRLCNDNIVNKVQQVICFAFHDSNLLLDTCRDAKEKAKIVTLFYLD